MKFTMVHRKGTGCFPAPRAQPGPYNTEQEVLPMSDRRTSVFENGLIWFGAGVSLAEILTGTLFAPLGFRKGLLAILLGHLIGCVMLFAAGLIGGESRRSAMETVKMSFGSRGGLLFALLNILQLVGWTAIMIYDGALAAGGVWNIHHWIWCLVIGGLIILWILIGITNLGRVNTVSMAALFALTVVLSVVIFRNTPAGVPDDSLSFGAAVELAVAMPLSWLPLISDYTREAKDPGASTLASTVVYGLVSTWMYIIGMGAAIFTGESDIARILDQASSSPPLPPHSSTPGPPASPANPSSPAWRAAG